MAEGWTGLSTLCYPQIVPTGNKVLRSVIGKKGASETTWNISNSYEVRFWYKTKGKYLIEGICYNRKWPINESFKRIQCYC